MPQVGDFGLSTGGGLPMWFVRLGTFSRYGHAALVLEVNDTGITIIEATPKKVRIRIAGPDEFKWSCLPLTDEQRIAIVGLATTTVGRGYDWPSLMRFLPRFFGAKVKGRSEDHSDDKLFCSELVCWAFRDGAGLDLMPGIAPGDTSPGDLSKWLCQGEIGKWARLVQPLKLSLVKKTGNAQTA